MEAEEETFTGKIVHVTFGAAFMASAEGRSDIYLSKAVWPVDALYVGEGRGVWCPLLLPPSFV